jgi:hypothetical protein
VRPVGSLASGVQVRPSSATAPRCGSGSSCGACVVREARDVECRPGGEEAERSGLAWSLQLAHLQRRLLEVGDVDLRARAREDHSDREPVVERELDRGPEPLSVVELPRRDAVEHGRVLDRVRVADLMRPDVERLEVVLVLHPPHDSGESALATDEDVGLEHPVRELHLRQGG